jgi:hypothetical protein
MRRWHIVVVGFLVVAPLDPTLPTRVRAALDAGYPGWRFATVLPALRRGLSHGKRPEWVTGDFDGDGRRDYAVQLVRARARPDSVQLIIALLARDGASYERHVVMAGGIHHGIWLARGTRGTRNRDLDADTVLVYRTDAIEIGYGEEAGESCLYLRKRFHCFVTSD